MTVTYYSLLRCPNCVGNQPTRFGKFRAWGLVILMMTLAGHLAVAGQRARMSKAYSPKASAPLRQRARITMPGS